MVDPVVERRIADGHAWEDTVVARLLEGTAFGTVSTLGTPLDSTQPVVVPSGVSRSERESITTEALRAGIPLIVGGRQPEEAIFGYANDFPGSFKGGFQD